MSAEAQASRPRRARMSPWLVVCLVAVVCVAAGQRIAGRLAAARSHSIPGLIDQLTGDREDAMSARDELAEKVGAGNVAFWRSLLDAPSARVRWHAADALTEVHTPGAAASILAGLTDYSSSVRITIMDGLPQMDRASALRPLLAALHDDDSVMRETAATQLRLLGDKRAVPALIGALRDPDRATAAGAVGALRSLTGQRFRARYMADEPAFDRAVRQWETWWAGARGRWPGGPALANVPAVPVTRFAAAPALRVRTLAGDTLDLQSLRGKVVLANFWGTWCGECLVEAPMLERIARDLGPEGAVVVGLAANERSRQDVQRTAKRLGLTYPLALADAGLCTEWDHVVEIPQTFLVDKHGRIRALWEGSRDYGTYATAVRKLLAEP